MWRRRRKRREGKKIARGAGRKDITRKGSGGKGAESLPKRSLYEKKEKGRERGKERHVEEKKEKKRRKEHRKRRRKKRDDKKRKWWKRCRELPKKSLDEKKEKGKWEDGFFLIMMIGQSSGGADAASGTAQNRKKNM